MHCVKVLFGRLEINLTCKRLLHPGKNVVRLTPISLKSAKVMQCCNVSKMDEENQTDPPQGLHGMKVLNKEAFRKTITVPCLTLETNNLSSVLKLLKKLLLKISKTKAVCELHDKRHKCLLDPNLIKTWNDFEESIVIALKKFNINEDNFSKEQIELGYDNWQALPLLKAILPKNESPAKSFSVIGHIIQLNLREHLLDYKHVIAEILFDKIPNIKTIVYKKSFINNLYRNIEMELLFGEPNYFVTVNLNHCVFEFDFSKVYWNPRLSTEHSRIVNTVQERDVLFDVFAGVGPFAIPSAKKKCRVFANDLNPDSVKWLNHNIKLNKKSMDYIKVFDKDGGDFILNDVKENLIKIWQDEFFNGTIHVVMNLPRLAPTFLKYFKGLITEDDLLNLDIKTIENCLPIVHCYFFSEREKQLKLVFEEASGMILDNFEHSFHYVRGVSNSSDMQRITLKLTFDYLLAKKSITETDEPLPKRLCSG